MMRIGTPHFVIREFNHVSQARQIHRMKLNGSFIYESANLAEHAHLKLCLTDATYNFNMFKWVKITHLEKNE